MDDPQTVASLLLAHTWHQNLDPAERALGRPYPPVGVLTSLAELRRAGHVVGFYDPTFATDVSAFAEALRGHAPARVAILADPHSVPQKMCLGSIRDAALQMVSLAKAAGARVLVAGPDVSDHPEVYAAADVVVIGEHDLPLLAFAAGDAQPARVPRAKARTDLAALPHPAWDDVDLPEYARRWRARHGHWELNISTARGCPYRCNWCAKPTWGRTWNVRPPEVVAEEVREARRRGADRIWFTDDIFAIKADWLDTYHRAVGRDALPFRCNTRADLVRDAAYTALLRAAGCVEVWMGAESGSDQVLAAMDKDQTVAEIARASELLTQNGIRRGFFLQLGYPGERYADVLQTVRMLRALRPEEIGISVSYPLPGTPFYAQVADQMEETRWSRSMENRMLFAGAYSDRFYQAARELLRSEHALRTWTPELSRRGLRRAAAVPLHVARWPVHRGRLWWSSRGTLP